MRVALFEALVQDLRREAERELGCRACAAKQFFSMRVRVKHLGFGV